MKQRRPRGEEGPGPAARKREENERRGPDPEALGQNRDLGRDTARTHQSLSLTHRRLQLYPGFPATGWKGTQNGKSNGERKVAPSRSPGDACPPGVRGGSEPGLPSTCDSVGADGTHAGHVWVVPVHGRVGGQEPVPLSGSVLEQ